MCGIAGFMLPQPALAQAEIEARLWAMIGTLRHRGPDDEGVWTDGLGALAHARLSIIDLSPAGHQPIASAGRRGMADLQWRDLQFRRDLREELAASGYVFRSRERQRGHRQWLARLGAAVVRAAARDVCAGVVGPPLAPARFWRATASARSRSITRRPNTGRLCCSARRSRRCSPGPDWRASRI